MVYDSSFVLFLISYMIVVCVNKWRPICNGHGDIRGGHFVAPWAVGNLTAVNHTRTSSRGYRPRRSKTWHFSSVTHQHGAVITMGKLCDFPGQKPPYCMQCDHSKSFKYSTIKIIHLSIVVYSGGRLCCCFRNISSYIYTWTNYCT